MTDFLSAWGFRAVVLAFRLGVFRVLTEKPRSPEETAKLLGLDPKGTAFLLDVLDCLGYVSAHAGVYSPTEITRHLVPMVSDGVPYFEKIVFRDWGGLEDRLRGATTLPFEPDEPRTPRWLAQEWRVFQDGMIALANMNIEEVVRETPVPASAGHVLDLGGGHGFYSIELCRRHQGLTSTVLEIPEMERIVRRTVAAHEMEGRVSFRAGDFFTDDLGTASVILLFNVIHSKSEPQNRKLVERVATAVEPGGVVVLLDQFAAPEFGPLGRAFGSMMSLSMYNNIGQQTYGLPQVREWFTQAGLERVTTRPLDSAPGNALVIGHRPA
ncbi:methyltransferase [Nonomuraea insulae]